ncbi:adenylate/guanylate cyclase domain-containing protein [Eudoraea adriatica]|uniref:adenylate/guanylate cyclase domain-containing protein n=1 Tax=Eudoraea adriatica TaxID=446681 RepID=UPI001F0B124C|nr:adenylate/guanylate cyclase domain-containing protein [Eudoraea adriatica]
MAQDQSVADSLKKIYHEGKLKGEAKLELLRNLSFNEVNDLELSLKYATELIALSKLESNQLYLYRGFRQKGDIDRLLGNLDIALNSYFKAEVAAIKAVYISGEGIANMCIADTYSEIGNSNNAQIYYDKAIKLLRQTDDTVRLATALLNAGDEAFNIAKYDLALQYFEESGNLFKKSNYLIGSAYNKGNIGMVYAEQGNNSLAEENINEAIKILEELEDYSPIAEYLTYISDIYLKKGDLPTALDYTKRSLNLAKKYGLKKQISESNLQLSELYEQAGNLVASYKYYKEHIVYRDSVRNLETVQQMADQRTNFEVSQKQTEVDLAEQREKNQRNMTIGTAIALVLIGIMAIGLYRRNNFIRKTKQIIEEEKERSDKLLLNILPEETALELKEKGKVKAKKYDAVTVLFSDFKGFTSYSEKLSPEALVETVDFYFSKFDAIIEKHSLEKIKTIGDAYMCAGGLHDNEKDHADRMISAALEIAAFVEETKNDMAASDLTFDIRIGINTGPVVAGVVGTHKFAYDIWGDAVNVASRMESNSEAGKINISENTYELIKDSYDCAFRGEIEVKNRGSLKMYYVEGMKSSVPA